MPTQIRLPDPNGINSKFCPLYSMFDPRNLSGLKDRGSSQESGSLPIAHTFTKTCVSLGIRYPMKFVSSKNSWPSIDRGFTRSRDSTRLPIRLKRRRSMRQFEPYRPIPNDPSLRNNAADMKRPNPARKHFKQQLDPYGQHFKQQLDPYGCNLTVSFITELKYGNRSMSLSSTLLSGSSNSVKPFFHVFIDFGAEQLCHDPFNSAACRFRPAKSFSCRIAQQ
uniref:Uncharacterized protein n=1 Tax=Salix viminalis TaxID=40686 RepID=A0A6N2M705_SALVM